jgi:hypothetical protein
MAGQVANVCWLADDRYVVSAGGHDRSLFQWKVVDPTGDGALVRPHNDAPCPPFTSHGASIAAPDSQPRVVARSERRCGRGGQRECRFGRAPRTPRRRRRRRCVLAAAQH